MADLRVGQEYDGLSYSYAPMDFRRFEIVQGETRVPVEGRLGDRPALGQPAPGEGLATVLHVTRDYTVTYSDYARFRDFVLHKDAGWGLAAHAGRGLPEEDFIEVYSRHAKALIAVGDGAGADRDHGLLTELTALANPFTDDLAGGLPVALSYEGNPRADAQIEVFEKAPEATVRIFTVRTDAEGRARVPVKPGHRYMLDAVVLREPTDALAAETGAVWESLWANLTFAVPVR